MSLINQMLRDLEARDPKGSAADGAGNHGSRANGSPAHIPDGVLRNGRRKSLALTALVLLGCGMGGGWYLAQRSVTPIPMHNPTGHAGITPAEHISIPQQPEPAPLGSAEVGQDSAPPPHSSDIHSSQPAPKPTSNAQKVAVGDKDSEPAAPSSQGKAAQGEEEQAIAGQKMDKPQTQVETPPKVSISHGTNPLEQRRQVLHQAQQHYAREDFAAAIALLQQHLEQNPRTEVKSGAATSDIIALDARIYRHLALAQLRLGQTDAAVNTLEQGHQRAGEDIELHILYARVLLEQNAIKRAYTMLRHMPQPQIGAHADFYALRAALARQRGFYSEAEELYALLCQNHPQRGDWRLGLALSQHQQGALEQAYQNYQRAADNPRLDAQLRDYASRQAQKLFSMSNRS